jgi:hypothetical protein
MHRRLPGRRLAFYTPRAGWLAWVADEGGLYVFDGGDWSAFTPIADTDGSFETLGVNAAADTTNRFAISAPATLLNHEGSGHQIKVNKHAAGDTASLLFQTDWSGRAEMGTAGDDDFHVKVSPDGSAWHDAVVIDKGSGSLKLPISVDGTRIALDPQSLDPDSGPWAFTAAKFDGVNAPHSARANTVFRWGYNVNAAGGLVNAGEPSCSWVVETCYYADGVNPFVETHWTFTDSTGTERRLMSFNVPHDGANGTPIGFFQIDELKFLAFDGTPCVRWNLANNSADFESAFRFTAMQNNYAVLRQSNADGTSYLNLPFITDGDCLRISQPIHAAGPRAGAAAPNPGTFLTVQPLTAIDGDAILFLQGPSVTGALTGTQTVATATTGLRHYMLNASSAPGADAGDEFLVIGATAGDPYTQYGVNGATTFRIGIDNSDADKFKVSASGTLGTDDVLSADPINRNVTFTRPPMVPGYTVAGAPGASTYGAGSMIYVSDEAGGAVLAFSDGSDWRRVTDRAVIS